MAVIDPREYRPGPLDRAWARTTGRSWWQAVYLDGHMVSEWQTLQSADPRTSRWEETDRKGLRTLVLLCPNGKGYSLRSGEDDKFFQLKQGVKQARNAKTIVLNHVIGVVTNTRGDCVCFAYEPRQYQLVADPAKRADCLVHAPNPHDGEGRYRRLDFRGADGVPVESPKFKGVLLNADGSCYCSRWQNTPDRVVKFEDNVLDMGYGDIGPLGLDNLRLKF